MSYDRSQWKTCERLDLRSPSLATDNFVLRSHSVLREIWVRDYPTGGEDCSNLVPRAFGKSPGDEVADCSIPGTGCSNVGLRNPPDKLLYIEYV